MELLEYLETQRKVLKIKQSAVKWITSKEENRRRDIANLNDLLRSCEQMMRKIKQCPDPLEISNIEVWKNDIMERLNTCSNETDKQRCMLVMDSIMKMYQLPFRLNLSFYILQIHQCINEKCGEENGMAFIDEILYMKKYHLFETIVCDCDFSTAKLALQNLLLAYKDIDDKEKKEYFTCMDTIFRHYPMLLSELRDHISNSSIFIMVLAGMDQKLLSFLIEKEIICITAERENADILKKLMSWYGYEKKANLLFYQACSFQNVEILEDITASALEPQNASCNLTFLNLLKHKPLSKLTKNLIDIIFKKISHPNFGKQDAEGTSLKIAEQLREVEGDWLECKVCYGDMDKIIEVLKTSFARSDEEGIDEGDSYEETVAELQEDTKENMDIFTSEFEILKHLVLSHMKEGKDKTIFYKVSYVQRLYIYLLESVRNDLEMRSYLDKKVMEWYQNDLDVSYMLLARSLNEILKLYDVPVFSKIEERKRFVKKFANPVKFGYNENTGGGK